MVCSVLVTIVADTKIRFIWMVIGKIYYDVVYKVRSSIKDYIVVELTPHYYHRMNEVDRVISWIKKDYYKEGRI